MNINITPLGAGQSVGKSCILVNIGGRNIMLDCGMHAGYYDHRMFPDFSYISQNGGFTDKLDCIIISHFHLDHIAALPYFTEVLGYNGPILMTHPTKSIAPILLNEFRRNSMERVKQEHLYTEENIENCIKKVTPLSLHQTITLKHGIEITAYYAGHVLGAAMFYIKVGERSLVYTGDFNMTPDRHLGSAWIERLRPDVLITESTYADMIRESKRSRERAFLKNIHSCVSRGGKVLVPVFAIGRAQELFILIEHYWERMGLDDVPIYFSSGSDMTANDYYRLFINWTSQRIKEDPNREKTFRFTRIQQLGKTDINNDKPMVIFATPSMITSGRSLSIFKQICNSPKNMVIMPGFCEANTIGARVLAGEKVIIDGPTTLNIELQVKMLQFSAHADCKGLMQIIQHLKPKHVVLVHGEKRKQDYLKNRVVEELGIPCDNPANGTTISVRCDSGLPVTISENVLKESRLRLLDRFKAYKERRKANNKIFKDSNGSQVVFDESESNLEFPIDYIQPPKILPIRGVLVMKHQKKAQFITIDEARADPSINSYIGQDFYVNIKLQLNEFLLQITYPETFLKLMTPYERTMILLKKIILNEEDLKNRVEINGNGIKLGDIVVELEEQNEKTNTRLLVGLSLIFPYKGDIYMNSEIIKILKKYTIGS